MDIVDHILALLHTEKKLLIPGFGEFQTTQEPAKVDAKRGVATPSRKTLKFKGDKKKKDDGVFKKYIAKKENITLPKASEKIKNFIKASEEILKKEKLSLPRIGKFWLNDKKQIIFEADDTLSFSVENFGMTKVKADKSEKEVKPLAGSSKASGTSAASDKSATSVTPDFNKPSLPTSNTMSKSTVATSQSSTTTPLGGVATDNVKKKKKSKAGLVYLTIIILLLMSLIYQLWKHDFDIQKTKDWAVESYHKIKEKIPFLTSSENEVNKQDLEKSAEDKIAEEMEKEMQAKLEAEKKQQEEQKNIEASFDVYYPNGGFYIIIASFQKETNAQKVLKKLYKSGVNTAEIVSKDGHNRVSIEKVYSIPEAEEKLKQARAKYSADVWVLNTEF